MADDFDRKRHEGLFDESRHEILIKWFEGLTCVPTGPRVGYELRKKLFDELDKVQAEERRVIVKMLRASVDLAGDKSVPSGSATGILERAIEGAIKLLGR